MWKSVNIETNIALKLFDLHFIITAHHENTLKKLE